jgi:hypothetical protein
MTAPREQSVVQAGQRWLWNGGEARVMCVCERWVMMRRRGCDPFVG